MTNNESEIIDKLSRIVELLQLLAHHQQRNEEFFASIIQHLENLDTLREMKRSGAARVAKYRAKKAANVTLQSGDVTLHKEEERKDEREEEKPSPRTLYKEIEEKEEKKGVEIPPSSPQGGKLSDEEINEMIESFWNTYPRYRRVDKKGVVNKLRSILTESTDGQRQREKYAEIMKGLNRWVLCDEWTKCNGKYAPMAMTWLNQERWNSEPLPNGSDQKPHTFIHADNWRGMREEDIEDVLS